MHATLARDDLASALATLARVVERRNTIPILSNVLVEAGDGRLSLVATDLDIEAETEIAAETGARADATIPAHMLHDIVRKLPSGAQVTLEADAAAGRVALRSGRSRFHLPSLPASDFPTATQETFDAFFDLPAKLLATALDAVGFAASTEETRYYLNGVFLHAVERGSETDLAFVATDGHRLARWLTPAPEGAQTLRGVIIPRKASLEIARLARDAEGDVALSVSERKLRARVAGFTLTTKLIDGTFPDYQRVIPSGNDIVASLRRADLAAAADRVSAISSERGRAVKLEFEPDVLRLTVQTPELGDAQEEMALALDGAPVRVGFNAGYLREALEHAGGDDTLMRLADAGSPALISNPADARLLLVLMPMRM